jgi:hypothetical protein
VQLAVNAKSAPLQCTLPVPRTEGISAQGLEQRANPHELNFKLSLRNSQPEKTQEKVSDSSYFKKKPARRDAPANSLRET